MRRPTRIAPAALLLLVAVHGGALGEPAVPTPGQTAPAGAGTDRPAAPYVDRLIGGEAGAASQPAEDSPEPEPEGFRSTVFEWRASDRDSSTGLRRREMGLRGVHRRETLNYGEILVEVSGQRDSVSVDGGDAISDRSGRLSLQQLDMPLADGWRMSNALGTLRTRAPGVLSGGLRFSLPGVMINGAGTRFDSATTSIVAETGELARLDGFDGFGLARIGGRSRSLGLGYRVAPDLRLAVQAIGVTDAPFAGSYTGWTVAAAGRSANADMRWRAQALGDDRQRAGGWIEVDRRKGFDHWHGALWRLDPNLYWYGVLLSGGQRGGSIGYDHVDTSSYWGGTVEIDRLASLLAGLGASDMVRLSLNGGHRLDLRHSVGGNLQFRQLGAPEGSVGGIDQRYVSMAVFLASTRGADRERWQYTLSDLRAQQSSTVHEFAWSRDLVFDGERTLGFTAGMGLEDSGGDRRFRPSVGVSYSGPLSGGARLDLWLRHARSSDAYRNEYVSSGAIQWSIPLAEHWQFAASAQLNNLVSRLESGSEPLFGPSEISSRDRSLWLTVRYVAAGGTPLLAGQPGNGAGAGSVEGVVYEDRNGDGVRQADEAPVAGVRIEIDGVLSARTGPDGRYVFPVVRTGRHAMVLDPSTVRLPWGPESDEGWRVEVEPRTALRRDLPVVRIGE